MLFTELLKQPEIQEFFHSIAESTDAFFVRKQAEKVIPSIHQERIPQLCALHFLRKKAKEKFSQAHRMCFTQRGFEQATSEKIAHYKMRILGSESNVLMLCSGIGGELLAAGEKTTHVTAIDNDPDMVEIASFNASELLPSFSEIHIHQMLVEDYVATLQENAFTHIFLDPDRRDEQRHLSLHAYRPNIVPLLPEFLRIAPHCYCKVAPGIPHEELYQLPYLSLVEYIEDAKGLKECLLHFERTTHPPVMVACTNVDHETMSSLRYPFRKEVSQLYLSEKQYTYIFEPSPALIRSGAVPLFYKDHGLVQREPSCAYGYTNALHKDALPWGTYFEIHAEIPFSKKHFKKYVHSKGITSCIIKKRYFPMEPHELRNIVQIPDGGSDIIIATTIHDRRVLLHCRYALEEKHIST